MSDDVNPTPRAISVVVASFRPRHLVEAAIRALGELVEHDDREVSVFLARAGDAEDVTDLAAGRPWLTVVPCADGATIPELRGAGMKAAGSGWIAVTEDHCLVDRDWLSCLARQAEAYDLVGGAMGNARPGLINWAAYFAEYGFFGPGANEGSDTPLMTGANMLYGPRVLDDVAEWAYSGLWEDVIHGRLLGRGARAAFEPDARVRQNGTYSLAAFCLDRYEHGRDYARVRVREQNVGRVGRFLSTPLLPAVLLARVGRSSAEVSPGRFLAASPVTLAFLSAWALGEAVGYLSGGRRVGESA